MKELYERVHEEVGREARLAASKWNGLVEADDIEQDLWLWIMESPALQKYLLTANGAQIKSAVSQKANSLCSVERRDYDEFTGQYTYNPADVRELLDTYWSTDVHNVSSEVMVLAEEHLSTTMIENILGGTISAEEKVDLELALKDLGEEHPDNYSAVKEQFYDGSVFESDAERKRRNRAVDKLTTIMNRKRSQRETDRVEGLGTKPKNTANLEEV